MPIAVTTVIKDTFRQCIKHKILLKTVFGIRLSNTFDFTQKIQNTKYFGIYFKYKIQNILYVFQIRIWNTCISNTLRHRPSPSKRRPVCHTRLTTVQRIIDFSLFDLFDSSAKVHQTVWCPTKFQPDRANGLRDMRYQRFSFFGLGPNPGPKFTKRTEDLSAT